jgi:hypothetical protein
MSLMTSRLSWPTLLAVMAVLAAGHSASADDSQAPAYLSEGTNGSAFAVGLRLPESERSTISRHVLLVDTSASQVGEYRREVLAVLNELLAALPAESEVSLMATDVRTVPLTDGFVAPHGEAMQAAMEKLNRRAPLGASDLGGALTTVLDHVDSSGPVSIGYLGDGMSAAQLLDLETLKLLTTELRDQQVVMNSYAIGPQTDLPLLGILAQQTGGRILTHDAESSVEERVAAMSGILRSGVSYPESLTLSGAEGALALQAGLPLRTDETLYLLGEGRVSPTSIVTARWGEKTIVWHVDPKSNAGNQTFLNVAVRNSRGMQGLFVAFPGEQLLLQSADAFSSQLDRMKELAQFSLSNRQFDQTREIALAMRELDPSNVDAGALLVAAQRKEEFVARVQNEQPVEPDQIIGDADLDLTEQTQQMIALRTQQLTTEVNILIDEARKLVLSDPRGALANLKKAHKDVTSAVDINEVSRTQLVRRLNTAIQEVQSQVETQELQQSFAQQRQVQSQALQRLREEMELEEEKFKQLLERVRSLMLDGRHGIEGSYESAANVAAEAIAIRPDSGPAAAAFFKAETATQLERTRLLRAIRATEFLNVLHSVEKAHVPFPDEPPILWPAPEVWQDMTERRKIWKQTNLKSDNPTEVSILEALDEPYQAEFFDMPLSDVIDDIKVNKRIPIIFDPNVIDTLDTGATVNLSLSGVTLRSILKMILQPMDLTYVIEDEVMKITTIEEAEGKFFIYVYPVGDLVVTPMSLQMGVGGGGMGGGMMGGMGGMGGMGMGGGMGGMGGMGGGMGGMGGGMGGMGGGMGGGFFSVSPPGVFNNGPRRAAPPVAPNRNRPMNNVDAENLLNEILGPQSSLESKPVKFQAQVRDTGAPRLDNSLLDQLKKKR